MGVSQLSKDAENIAVVTVLFADQFQRTQFWTTLLDDTYYPTSESLRMESIPPLLLQNKSHKPH